MNINTTTTKNIVKISGLLFAVIVLSILYTMIGSGSYATAFIEGNECMDVENKAKDKIASVLNVPVANANDSPRITQQDMISKIKKIESDVENGTGDFKGNTKKCFPGRVKINLDLDMDPDMKIQKIQSSLIPDKSDNTDSSSK